MICREYLLIMLLFIGIALAMASCGRGGTATGTIAAKHTNAPVQEVQMLDPRSTTDLAGKTVAP